jgi:hypothetical protein
MTSVRSVWKCLSAVHREVHQAHPDVDVVKGYVRAFLDEVDLLRGQNTPKPCRYRGKFYDDALASSPGKPYSIRHMVYDVYAVLKNSPYLPYKRPDIRLHGRLYCYTVLARTGARSLSISASQGLRPRKLPTQQHR